MKRASCLRRATGVVLSVFLALGYFSPLQQTLRTMPDTLALTQGQVQSLQLPPQLQLTAEGNLAVSSSEDETLQLVSETAGAGELMLSLMGVIPLKKVEVSISPEKRLIPGGSALGVAMRTDGVLVVGTSDLSNAASPATLCGIRPGDVLRTVNGEKIMSSQQLTELIARLGEKPLPVEYAREGTVFTTTMTPRLDESTGTVRIGAWVRDSTAGVGTLSFYDPDTGRYAALGHAITDGDTGAVLTVSQGQILKADVVAVQRGQKGTPGELKGSFLMDPTTLGDIRKNTVLGIYGAMKQAPVSTLYPQGLPIGLRSGVHEGPATILSTVDGTGVQEFQVEITRVNQQNAPAPKSMVIKVTDPRLLAATGGIVQGMSGSPIIQDGRLVGAVTHVFVSDPTQGYGLYVDWMLQEANAL